MVLNTLALDARWWQWVALLSSRDSRGSAGTDADIEAAG